MKKLLISISLLSLPFLSHAGDVWPDGTAVSEWFSQTAPVNPDKLGKRYVVTDYGVVKGDSTLLQTEAIQKVIDLAAENGGGVVTIPEGVYLSGSLFFKPGTHLNIAEGGRLKGSDAITHYKIVKTRLEGQTIDYFAALVNADGMDGFTITGPGTIDGNGWRFWDEFWLRRKVNPDCTNLEA
ncbi:MAG: exopolygalacturonase, partial [Muribaculaceae bacterium]|nr:exopolygalacturonase [Muribaculaceae bacterium]